MGRLSDALKSACPELRSFVLFVDDSEGNTVLKGKQRTIYGSDAISDELCNLRFELSPLSFYQINPVQAERLYRIVSDCAALSGGLALDLYCGAGTIALHLSRYADKVIGAEIVPEAVLNARENARRNGITNAEFMLGDAAEAAKTLLGRGTRPDVVVVDPPRKGLSPSVIESIAGMAPDRVVYVSCDPGTLARDLAVFAERGYAPVKGVAVDMFPRTRHVECVVLMSRTND